MSHGGTRPRSDLSLGLYLILGLVASLGPISVDTYLPALPEIASSLDASDGMTQMSVTAFLLGLVLGPVVFGPISDAIGRRRLVLGSLVVYSLVSLSIATVGSVEMLIGLRLAQAACGGTAIALARSMARDLLSGDALARAMSILTMIILGAPIVAPFLGALLLLVWGWQAIFVALGIVGGLVFVAAWYRLPETHPPEHRHPLDLATVLRGYASITRSRVAVSYAIAGGAAAAILFAYLAAAPFIYIDYYGLEEQWFGVLFGVGVVGAWLAQMVNIRYVMTIGYRRIVLVGAFCLAALSTVLWWVTRTDLWGLAGVVSVSVVVLSMIHLVTPGTQAGVLDEFPPDLAGSASGFSTFARFTLGAAGSGLVGLFNDGTPKTYGLVVMVAAVITLAAAALARPLKTASGTISRDF
ncbi:MAG: multidrug effflux MFS transporter [bacterium]|nr:multidrug effflux MFS transporter [bacterium]